MEFYDPVVTYQQPNPYGGAPTLVRLGAIFNFIMCGIDFLYGIIMAVVFAMFASGAIPLTGATPGSPMVRAASTGPSPPPLAVMLGLFGFYVVASLAVGTVKLIAGLKLARKRRGAWGWALAAGIVGCIQLWCSLGCILPLANAVFTIVLVCLPDVRRYLHDSANTPQGSV